MIKFDQKGLNHMLVLSLHEMWHQLGISSLGESMLQAHGEMCV